MAPAMMSMSLLVANKNFSQLGIVNPRVI